MGELMPDRATIGERLKKLRGDRTLEEIGKALNVTSMAVSLWERGERIPSDDMKMKISIFYDVPITDLFYAQ